MIIPKADRLKTVKEYYFSRKLKEIRKMKDDGIDVINLGIGSPDLPPANEVIDKLTEAAKDKKNHAYQSYAGIPELKKAFAAWYNKFFGVEPDINEILPLIGSKEGIMHISMAFLNPGDKVLLPNPGYPTYKSVSDLVGAETVYYNLKKENGWYPDFEELDKTDITGVKIMWVNYPNMPTGAGASKELFEKLVDFGKQNNILIVNDNPYSFILNDEQLSILSVDGAKEVALELNSLSKSHNMAGWRVGVVAGDKDYISTILQVKSNMDSGMFKAVQLAAAKALELDKNWYKGLNKVYSGRRNIVFEILDILGFNYDKNQTGMFVWAEINGNYPDAESFSDKLLINKGVFITPGIIFGSNGKKFVRISLCTENERLKEAKERINEFVNN